VSILTVTSAYNSHTQLHGKFGAPLAQPAQREGQSGHRTEDGNHHDPTECHDRLERVLYYNRLDRIPQQAAFERRRPELTRYLKRAVFGVIVQIGETEGFGSVGQAREADDPDDQADERDADHNRRGSQPSADHRRDASQLQRATLDATSIHPDCRWLRRGGVIRHFIEE
jgi:hypothetical protein